MIKIDKYFNSDIIEVVEKSYCIWRDIWLIITKNINGHQ